MGLPDQTQNRLGIGSFSKANSAVDHLKTDGAVESAPVEHLSSWSFYCFSPQCWDLALVGQGVGQQAASLPNQLRSIFREGLVTEVLAAHSDEAISSAHVLCQVEAAH